MKRLMKRDWTGSVARKVLLPTGAVALIALLAGCASTPDHYYTLAAPATTTAAAVPVSASPMYIELAPIALPERLARPQLLVRRQGAESSAQVDLLEQHRWTSSFENELRDALGSGIASRLGAIDVTKGGKPTGQPVWRIAVQVRQFDAVENSRVDADMVWTLKRADREPVVTCSWSASEPVGSSSGIDGLAQAAQRVTAMAAANVARTIAALRVDASSACQR